MYKLEAIEIQTISYCNSSCIVCPWHDMKGETTMEHMPDEIWKKLLKDLSVLKPDWVIPYLNNEPFMDKTILHRLGQIKKYIPTAKIELSTNGMLLNQKIADELCKMDIDKILVSIFGNSREQNFKIMGKSIDYDVVCHNAVYLKKKLKETGARTDLAVVKLAGLEHIGLSIDEIDDSKFWEENSISVIQYGFVNRSGLVKSIAQRDPNMLPEGCDFNRHLDRVYVFHNGNVSFCCHDWHQKYIVGNLNEQSLNQILTSKNYNYRRLQVEGIESSDVDFLCRSCYHCVKSNRPPLNNISSIQKMYQKERGD